jgi:hypothetical protein
MVTAMGKAALGLLFGRTRKYDPLPSAIQN